MYKKKCSLLFDKVAQSDSDDGSVIQLNLCTCPFRLSSDVYS